MQTYHDPSAACDIPKPNFVVEAQTNCVKWPTSGENFPSLKSYSLTSSTNPFMISYGLGARPLLL